MRSWLVDARKAREFTQNDVALLVRMSRQGYGFIETGERNPSVKMAKKIAKVLKVDWTRFFEEA